MPKTTSTAVAKKWLERLDEGETEAQIARSERKDLRTVRGAIEKMRHERDMAVMRRDILKESYRRHLDDMLATLADLNGLIGSPPDELPLRYPGSQQPIEWRLSGCRVIYNATETPEVICALEDTLVFRLLREHLKGDQLWRYFDAWKNQLGQVIESHLRLSEKTKTELQKSTKLPIGIPDEREDHITPEGAHLIYRFAVKEAAETKGLLAQHINAMFEEGEDGIVQCDMDGVTWKMGKGLELCNQLMKVMQGLSGSPEVERLRNSRVKMEEAAQQSKEIIALIRAGWYVPGKCRVCERMKQ